MDSLKLGYGNQESTVPDIRVSLRSPSRTLCPFCSLRRSRAICNRFAISTHFVPGDLNSKPISQYPVNIRWFSRAWQRSKYVCLFSTRAWKIPTHSISPYVISSVAVVVLPQCRGSMSIPSGNTEIRDYDYAWLRILYRHIDITQLSNDRAKRTKQE